MQLTQLNYYRKPALICKAKKPFSDHSAYLEF